MPIQSIDKIFINPKCFHSNKDYQALKKPFLSAIFQKGYEYVEWESFLGSFPIELKSIYKNKKDLILDILKEMKATFNFYFIDNPIYLSHPTPEYRRDVFFKSLESFIQEDPLVFMLGWVNETVWPNFLVNELLSYKNQWKIVIEQILRGLYEFSYARKLTMRSQFFLEVNCSFISEIKVTPNVYLKHIVEDLSGYWRNHYSSSLI